MNGLGRRGGLWLGAVGGGPSGAAYSAAASPTIRNFRIWRCAGGSPETPAELGLTERRFGRESVQPTLFDVAEPGFTIPSLRPPKSIGALPIPGNRRPGLRASEHEAPGAASPALLKACEQFAVPRPPSLGALLEHTAALRSCIEVAWLRLATLDIPSLRLQMSRGLGYWEGYDTQLGASAGAATEGPEVPLLQNDLTPDLPPLRNALLQGRPHHPPGPVQVSSSQSGARKPARGLQEGDRKRGSKSAGRGRQQIGHNRAPNAGIRRKSGAAGNLRRGGAIFEVPGRTSRARPGCVAPTKYGPAMSNCAGEPISGQVGEPRSAFISE